MGKPSSFWDLSRKRQKNKRSIKAPVFQMLLCLIMIGIIWASWTRQELALISASMLVFVNQKNTTADVFMEANNEDGLHLPISVGNLSYSKSSRNQTSDDGTIDREIINHLIHDVGDDDLLVNETTMGTEYTPRFGTEYGIRFMQEFRDGLISGKIDRSKQQQEENENRPRIVHVWPPYAVTNKGKDENPFYPLDQAQNVTWQSLYEAQQDYNRYNSDVPLHIYCAVLWTDVQVIQNHRPPLCKPGKYNHIVVLDRSSHTEYPSLKPPIHYPFIQDIFTATLNHQNNNNNVGGNKDWDFDYFIYTNSDIAVIKYFYTLIAKVITTFRYDAFIVNRRTIPQIMNNHSLTSNDLPYIEGELLEKEGRYHPGTDCFVMDKSIITNINLGDLFLGNPPWAKVLKNILNNHMAYQFHIFESIQQYRWTYHLGDDRTWHDRPEQKVVSRTKAKYMASQCIFGNDVENGYYTDHWFQNTMNCAEIFTNMLTAMQQFAQLGYTPRVNRAHKDGTVDIASTVNEDTILPAFVSSDDLEIKRRFYQVTLNSKPIGGTTSAFHRKTSTHRTINSLRQRKRTEEIDEAVTDDDPLLRLVKQDQQLRLSSPPPPSSPGNLRHHHDAYHADNGDDHKKRLALSFGGRHHLRSSSSPTTRRFGEG